MTLRIILVLLPVLLSACGATKPPQLPSPSVDSLNAQIKHALAEFDTLSARLKVLEAGGIVPVPKVPIVVTALVDPEVEAAARRQLQLLEEIRRVNVEILELLHRAVVTPAPIKKK